MYTHPLLLHVCMHTHYYYMYIYIYTSISTCITCTYTCVHIQTVHSHSIHTINIYIYNIFTCTYIIITCTYIYTRVEQNTGFSILLWYYPTQCIVLCSSELSILLTNHAHIVLSKQMLVCVKMVTSMVFNLVQKNIKSYVLGLSLTVTIFQLLVRNAYMCVVHVTICAL